MAGFGTGLILKMAWRNLGRQRRRTVLTVFAMAVGLGLCIPTFGLTDGMNANMIQGITRVHYGHIQVHNPKYPKDRNLVHTLPAEEVLKKVSAIKGVVGVAPRVYSGGMVSNDLKVEVFLEGFDRGKGIPEGEKLTKGRALGPKDRCHVLIAMAAARRLHLDLGSTLRLSPLPPNGACERIEVVGVLHGGIPRPVRVIMRSDQVRTILAKPPDGKSPDLDDEDIDSLPKDTDEAKPAAGTAEKKPVEKPKAVATGPSKGKWGAVRAASHPVGIVAIQPDREKQVTLMAKKLFKGKYLSDKYRKNRGRKSVFKEILIGESLAKLLMVKPGDVVGMDMATRHGYPLDELFKVVGIFKTGLDEMDRSLVYVHIGNAWDPELMAMFHGVAKGKGPDPGPGKGMGKGKAGTVAVTGPKAVHELAVRLRPKLNEAEVAGRIRKALGSGVLVRTWQQVDPTMAKIIQFQDTIIAIMLAIIFAIAALGTMNTMLMAVWERTKEFGVLKSVGMKPRQVAGLIVWETLLMTVLAAVIGTAIGLGLDWYLVVHGLDLTAYMPHGVQYQGVFLDPVWRAIITVKGVVLPIVLLSVISLLVSVWPAVRAGRLQPVKALRQHA